MTGSHVVLDGSITASMLDFEANAIQPAYFSAKRGTLALSDLSSFLFLAKSGFHCEKDRVYGGFLCGVDISSLSLLFYCPLQIEPANAYRVSRTQTTSQLLSSR